MPLALQPYLEGLPGEDSPAGAASENSQLLKWELPAPELRYQALADEPSSYDRHGVSLAHIRGPPIVLDNLVRYVEQVEDDAARGALGPRAGPRIVRVTSE